MPASRPQANSNARIAPYPSPTSNVPICPKHGKPGIPILDEADKENHAPPRDKSAKTKKAPSKEPDRSQLPSNYLDIPLEDIKGEVPVYDNVIARYCHRINRLLTIHRSAPKSAVS